MLPSVVLLAMIMWPFLTGVLWSFSSLNGDGSIDFVGFDNYVDIFTPGNEGIQGFFTTLQFAGTSLALELIIGFLVAMLLTWPKRWIKVFRTLIIVPLLLPPVVASIIIRVMVTDRGVVNSLLEGIGLDRIAFLGQPIPAFWTVVGIDVWLTTPFVILILLAGLESVPQEVIEASTVDGAGIINKIRHIYLPMLRPFLVVVIVFRGIDALKTFDSIWTATQGGPQDVLRTLHIHGYQFAVQYQDFGRSMTFLVVLWLLANVLATILLKYRRKESTNG
jgi:multiple sugar transport system permease protein